MECCCVFVVVVVVVMECGFESLCVFVSFYFFVL